MIESINDETRRIAISNYGTPSGEPIMLLGCYEAMPQRPRAMLSHFDPLLLCDEDDG